MPDYRILDEEEVFNHEMVLHQAVTHVSGRQSYLAMSGDGHIMQVEYLPKDNKLLVHISRRRNA